MRMENKHYGISFEVATYHKLSYIYKKFPHVFCFHFKILNNKSNQMNG